MLEIQENALKNGWWKQGLIQMMNESLHTGTAFMVEKQDTTNRENTTSNDVSETKKT